MTLAIKSDDGQLEGVTRGPQADVRMWKPVCWSSAVPAVSHIRTLQHSRGIFLCSNDSPYERGKEGTRRRVLRDGVRNAVAGAFFGLTVVIGSWATLELSAAPHDAVRVDYGGVPTAGDSW